MLLLQTAPFLLQLKENLLIYQEVAKYYDQDFCVIRLDFSLIFFITTTS